MISKRLSSVKGYCMRQLSRSSRDCVGGMCFDLYPGYNSHWLRSGFKSVESQLAEVDVNGWWK